MKLVSPCKINLSLKVFEKNDGGFHRLQTLMVRVALFDHMEIEITTGASEISVEVDGHPEIAGQSNILFRTVDGFRRGNGLDFGARVRLQKTIPMGAGLGGGSANAAYILRFLNQHLGHPMQPQALFNYATTLGSDVGFFMLDDSWAACGGYGNEIQTQGSMEKLPLVLCFPNVAMDTPAMYKRLARPLTWDQVSDKNPVSFHVERWSDFSEVLPLENDFETVIQEPFLADIKQVFGNAGCVHSALSGSGSTVFGLFERSEDAQRAAKMVQPFGQVFVTSSF